VAHRARTILCVVLASTAALPSTARAGQMLLQLDTEDHTAWREVGREIQRWGGRVLRVHPPQVLIADVDPTVAAHLVEQGVIGSAAEQAVESAGALSLSARAGIAFWNHIRESGPAPEGAPEEGEDQPVQSDVFLPPDTPAHLIDQFAPLGFRTVEEEAQARSGGTTEELTSVGPSTYYTSEFMSGEIVVGAILPESNGVIDANIEDWTTSEVDTIHSRIMTALQRFQDDCPIADITLIFHFDDAPANGGVAGTIDCDYEAILSSGSALGNALSKLVYDGSPSTRSYANHLRDLYGADWGFLFHVVDNTVTGGGRAFAYLGGPYTQCYGHNSSSVFQHETGHIFRAMDEYHPDAARSPTGRWGYQQVVNANSQYNDGTGFNGGAGEGLSALMRNNINKHSAYSTGQIGWYDSDGDGILDVSDSFPAATVAVDSVVDGVVVVSGQATVSPVRSQRSGFNVGFSVNELVGVEWRIAGQVWQPASPTDGTFDRGVEDFSFVTPALPDGPYTIEVRATNNKTNRTQLPTRLDVDVAGSPATDIEPFAAFEATPAVQRVGFDVSFDASACSDLETASASLTVRWDFDGDAVWDTSPDTNKTTTHSYASTGLYPVAVEVQDGLGNTAVATRDVLIVASNVAPVAALEVPTGNLHGTFGPEYTFDASASYDPEGSALEVRWDWDANGTYDTGYSTDLVAQRTYSLPTTDGGKSDHWTVVAQLRDPDGATTEITREIWSCPYNDPPQLAGFVDPPLASTDTLVIFDMSATTDANIGTTWDGVLEYRYDFDGDGNWDTDMAADPVGMHTYPETGIYQARVEVRDRFYGLDETTFAVEVGTDPVPQPFIVTGATLSPSYMQVAPGTTVTLDLDLEYVGTPGDLSAVWEVDGIEGGDATVGTITAGGEYTAPAELGYHQIRATSNNNPSVVAYGGVYVNTNFVELIPSQFELVEGETLQFTVNTGFSVDPTVSLFVNDIPGGHALVGLIDAAGLLTAPAHVFGEIQILVRATSNEDPSVSAWSYGTLRSSNPPTADFSASVVQGAAPLSVDFTSLATGAVYRWDWDFDDGTTAGGSMPTHVFQDPGLYTVTLDVTAPGGTARETKVAYIQADGGTAPLIDFSTSYNPMYSCGEGYCSASFTPVVVGDVDTYAWDFGGLDTDDQMQGTWMNAAPGVHTISVTATGPGGSTTKTKPDYLEVLSSPGPLDFRVHGLPTGVSPFSVEFVALPGWSTCATYTWDFGDTGEGTGPNPTHVYETPGVYTVSLTVDFSGDGSQGGTGCGTVGGDREDPTRESTATVTKVNLIEVYAPAIPAASAWSLVLMTLALLASGAVLVRLRQGRPERLQPEA